MRRLLVSTAVIAAAVCGGAVTVQATPLALSLVNRTNAAAAPVEKVGYWRRLYRRGYVVPYIYYPPAYGYYAPPPAYAYYPPAYGVYAPPAYNYNPPAYGEQAPPPADGGYSEHPPTHGYEAPPPDGGS
jgi:hypothetical protein